MALYFEVSDGTGSGYKPYGGNVSISAYAPNTGSEFDSWKYAYGGVTVANSGASSTTAYMTTNTSITNCGITATYKLITTLYFNVSGGSGDGTYDFGETVGISADSPSFGYVFYKWTSINNCSIGNIYSANTSATMGSSGEFASVSSSYAKILYTISFTATGGGYVSGQTTQYIYYNNSGTQVEAIANSGYHFVKWDDENYSATRTPTSVSANATYQAIFEANDHTVNFYTTTGGYLTGDVSQIVNLNDDGTEVIAVPYVGYAFSKWSDDDTNPSKTPTNVVTNLEYTAYFTSYGILNMKWYEH